LRLYFSHGLTPTVIKIHPLRGNENYFSLNKNNKNNKDTYTRTYKLNKGIFAANIDLLAINESTPCNKRIAVWEKEK